MMEKQFTRREFLLACLKLILLAPILGLLDRLGNNFYNERNSDQMISNKEARYYKHLAG